MTQRRLTAEVLAAMRQQGVTPEPPAPPVGQVRYHIAVEQTLLSGTAEPSVVATVLRGLAAQLDQQEKSHG